MEHNFLFALSLTILAGLATGVGGILGFFIKRENMSVLSLGLGFSAGVMIYVSFVEILKKSTESLVEVMGNNGEWIALVAFFGGIGLAALIDQFIPDHVSPKLLEPDESSGVSNLSKLKSSKLIRAGLFTALAVSIHNFPEGLATFMSAMTDPTLGISIAIAIAIHNIPEGVAVALPIYYATGSRNKALGYAFLSGIAEPIGALFGFFLLSSLFNNFTFGILFGAVAGIMVYISFDELLPMAREYDKGHLEILGVISGMLVISISLVLF